MSVVPKLNFNKHPKDCDNLSLMLVILRLVMMKVVLLMKIL